MVIDHANALWFDRSMFFLSLLGRGAFPLFCYAVAVATLKHSKNYTAHLLMLAVVAQPFFQWSMELDQANVVFTLAAGSAFAAWSLRAKTWHVIALSALSLLAAALPEVTVFGWAGTMLPAAIVLAMQGKRVIYPVLVLLLFALNGGGLVEHGDTADYWLVEAQLVLASVLLPLIFLHIAKGLSQTGRVLPKYALHAFYPLHLALLKLLGIAFIP